MAKKFTHIKEVKEKHQSLVREHLRDVIERAIAAAVHVQKDEISTLGLSKIDLDLANELKEAGYTYSKPENKIKW